jgi:hypothetical protein
MAAKPNVVYCCSLLKDAVHSKGRAGLAILPGRDPRFGLVFVLEFRAVSEQDDGQPLNSGDVKVYRRLQQAIRFCPWCGKNLSEFYKSQEDALPLVDCGEIL